MNTCQQDVKCDDDKLRDVISTLLGENKQLLDFLFDPKEAKLRKRPGILRDDAWRFTDEERLLIRAALDLWSGSGHVQLWELLETWSAPDWIRFIAALRELRNLSGYTVTLK